MRCLALKRLPLSERVPAPVPPASATTMLRPSQSFMAKLTRQSALQTPTNARHASNLIHFEGPVQLLARQSVNPNLRFYRQPVAQLCGSNALPPLLHALGRKSRLLAHQQRCQNAQPWAVADEKKDVNTNEQQKSRHGGASGRSHSRHNRPSRRVLDPTTGRRSARNFVASSGRRQRGLSGGMGQRPHGGHRGDQLH